MEIKKYTIIVAFLVGIMALFVVLFYGVFTWVSTNWNRNTKFCVSITDEMNSVDSLFLGIECKGVIDRIAVKTFSDHHNLIYIYIEPLKDFNFVGKSTVTRQILFQERSAKVVARLGVHPSVDEYIEEGDTFVKLAGYSYYYVINNLGDTLISEPTFRGHCAGNNCTWDRSSGKACSYY